MKNVFINSVLVVFALLVASCGRQPEAKVEVMSFNIRLDHVTDIDDKRNVTTATLIYSLNRIIGVAVVMN